MTPHQKQELDGFTHMCVGMIMGFCAAFAAIDLGWIEVCK